MFHLMHYINDTDFQIVYINHQLNIINYEKINYMEDSKISLTYQETTVVVSGNNLRIKKLLDNEIMIVGQFTAIEFRN